MTNLGGSHDKGVIFSFDPATNFFTRLYNFDITNGRNPYGSLIQANDGYMYGMTKWGGTNDEGVIFSFDAANSIYTNIHNFDYTNGGLPLGSLLQASDGKLYGMTSVGGTNGSGVAFSFEPVTNTYIRRADFMGNNGAFPYYTTFTEYKSIEHNLPRMRIGNVSDAEGNSGSKMFNFRVTLSGASKQPVTVQYKTANGTATTPEDYTSKSGTLTFAPGVKKRYISIIVKGDIQGENDETFKVVLSNATGATIVGNGRATGTILDDDGIVPPTAKQSNGSHSIPSITVSPNPASHIIQVQLSGYSGKVMLQLTDINGKVLKSINIQAGNVKAMQQFNVAEIANGTYMITATDEKGNKQTVKVVVLH